MCIFKFLFEQFRQYVPSSWEKTWNRMSDVTNCHFQMKEQKKSIYYLCNSSENKNFFNVTKMIKSFKFVG